MEDDLFYLKGILQSEDDQHFSNGGQSNIFQMENDQIESDYNFLNGKQSQCFLLMEDDLNFSPQDAQLA